MLKAKDFLNAFNNTSILDKDLQDRFILFSPETQETLKKGFWIYEGMPNGDSNFGGTFFKESPRNKTVKKVIEAFINNSGKLFSEKAFQEILNVETALKNPDENKARTAFNDLSYDAKEAIKKAIWVKEGSNPKAKMDFAGDLINKNPKHPSMIAVVEQLATKMQ